MSNGFLSRAVIAGLLGLLVSFVACSTSPAGPTPPATAAGIPSVRAVFPAGALAGDGVRVTVTGSGFLAGARVTLGGTAASVTSVLEGAITAITPVHDAGSVDVVVTNPDGHSGTLAGGYTYQAVTLTVSSDTVVAGGQLSVSWVAPPGRSVADWIALLKVGSPVTSYAKSWWEYTKGATSGTLTLSAPTEPGQYEFHYLLDDDFGEVGRSGLVTVRAPASPLAGR